MIATRPEILDRLRRAPGYLTVEQHQLADVLSGRLSAHDLVAYLVVQSHGRTDTATRPSNARIASMLGVDARVARQRISRLAEARWIDRALDVREVATSDRLLAWALDEGPAGLYAHLVADEPLPSGNIPF